MFVEKILAFIKKAEFLFDLGYQKKNKWGGTQVKRVKQLPMIV